jgi:ribonucleoside-triphosphate reductase
MLIINAALKPKRFRFSEDFLAPYYKEGDPFQSLLARSTYLNKYCRDKETWTDTIRRVVEANLSLAASTNEQEAKILFHLFWTGQALPPGRGLWTGGVEGIPADARYNCWYTTLYGIDDWCWTANQLMLGGGVGVGLGEIDTLPVVQREPQARFSVLCSEIHPDVNDVNPNAKNYLNGQTHLFRVPDSREGWVEALRTVLTSAFYAKDLIVDVSDVRARGMPIRTFGGIACGPGPLTNLLRNSWKIVRKAAGRRLNSVEALDITNYIGLCIKAGNVRRSALIAIGDAYDQAFRDAKKDMDKVISHRHTSNNTIAFRSWDQLQNFDWDTLVQDMSENGSGEPGILNLPLVWKTDAGAKGVNPCGEVPLHDREACNLAEVFPAKFESNTDADLVFKLITRYCLRQRLTPLLDERADSVQKQNMRVGVGLGGLCDFDWTQPQLNRWYHLCRDEASSYSKELGVADPIAVTTVKPSGTISLLNGSSPGIHAPYADYYLRRTRIAKNDPMALAMAEAGVPFEDDVYDESGHTWVFAFPTKSPNSHITVQNETIRDQFDRQKAVQSSWADNAVSATLSFAENERAELADCLREYVPFLKSTSTLPKTHGYAQAPYEVCSKEEYERLYAMINHKHPLVRGGDFEVEECGSGVCPVR